MAVRVKKKCTPTPAVFSGKSIKGRENEWYVNKTYTFLKSFFNSACVSHMNITMANTVESLWLSGYSLMGIKIYVPRSWKFKNVSFSSNGACCNFVSMERIGILAPPPWRSASPSKVTLLPPPTPDTPPSTAISLLLYISRWRMPRGWNKQHDTGSSYNDHHHHHHHHHRYYHYYSYQSPFRLCVIWNWN